MSRSYYFDRRDTKCNRLTCIKPICYAPKKECSITKIIYKKEIDCVPVICPKKDVCKEPCPTNTQTNSPNIQINVGAGSSNSSGVTGPTGATGPAVISAFAYATFKTPFISNSPNGERSVPIAFLEDPTSDKRYSRLPFETLIDSSAVGVTMTNTTIPADNIAFPGFGYPKAFIDTGNVLNYTYTTFNLQPGHWKISWYANFEFLIYPQKILNNAMSYYQLGIAEQNGSNTPTVLSHTIRKAYGIPNFPPIENGFTDGFVSGDSIIRVTNASANYYIIFFKGPNSNGSPAYAKLQFEPKLHEDVFYQQTSISFLKVADL